jgi:transposase
MISKEREAEILRLYHAEKWPIGTIAKQLGVHHVTVQRVLRSTGTSDEDVYPRASAVDPYMPFILETLEQYPRLLASRLYEMVKSRGYTGSPDHFRKIIGRHRPRKPSEAYHRLRTLPGEQAQVDWAHFGKVEVGRARRPLWGFVMVLSYSRHIYVRFFYDGAMPNFLRGHVGAFHHFGGVPRVLLYDNLKSAVIERRGDAIRFNDTLLELSGHYRFEPRPVAPARGNEKGRVERAIRYIRGAFFAARPWTDLADLNRQAMAWSLGGASERRCPEDRDRLVRDVFEEEKPKLLALPDDDFPAEDNVPVEIGKTPYARFDRNDYSVPAEYARRTLVVRATLDTVRIMDAATVVAEHARSFDRGQQIEDTAHIAELTEIKAKSRYHRGFDRLTQAAPSSTRFFEVVAERGGNLGSTTARLLEILARSTAADLEAALVEALARDTVHLGAVRQIIDQRRAARGQVPGVLPSFASDKHKGIVVKTHALKSYDSLSGGKGDD